MPFKSFKAILVRGWMLLVVALTSASAQETRGAEGLRPLEDPSSKPPSANTSASSTVAYTNSMDVLDDKRKLSVGDRVSLRIVEDHKPPTTNLIVTDSGEMEVPLIGRVAAKGKTCKALALEIKKLLEVDYFFRCTVILGLDAEGKRSRGVVYVTGQIRNQGALELPSEESFTVSKAILRCGGFADFANRKKVRVVRKNGPQGSQTLYVNIDEVLSKGHLEKDLELLPEDVVIVSERLINF